jgi:ATP-binding cassette subfamily C protein
MAQFRGFNTPFDELMAEVDRMAAELRSRPTPVSEPAEFDDTDDLAEEEDQPDVAMSAAPDRDAETETDIAEVPVSHAAPVSETAQAAPFASAPGIAPALAEISSDAEDTPEEAYEPVASRSADLSAEPELERPQRSSIEHPVSAGQLKSIDGDTGPLLSNNGAQTPPGNKLPKASNDAGNSGDVFHRRLGPINLADNLKAGVLAVRRNLLVVMGFTLATNILVLAIPVYLFQISDRVLTSRSIDTLVMLTIIIAGAVILNAVLDAVRRFILMRTAVEVAAQLGAPILGAAARASLHSNGREYQTLGDLQQLRSFLVSGTLLSFLDAPLAPLFMLAVFLVHPHLGYIVVVSAILLLVIAYFNQKVTAQPFHEAGNFQSKANLHLDSMSRNSQIINALAMIPEAVKIWGQDTAGSLKAQVLAQDRNVISASISKAVRLLTQVAMLGWGAYLSIEGQLTGGMVIAASIIAGRALAPVEGAIEGWHQFLNTRSAYQRISALLKASPLNFERLKLPKPQGRLDVERLLFVPQGTKRVVLNGVTFSLAPGESLAIIGDSGAGKTTLGKMLVGSILPTSGSVRLDLMDLRNWDQRQFGENIGYLPQDVQLFPGTIKANIGRMRDDASDEDIYKAAMLADVHELISSFAQGYETIVAADGSPLSGGQKQRIALARAFFGNPHLVVLDEPNSNLDGAGDAALLRALEHAKKEKITVITITQRPSLLNGVDKILLLSNGAVSMFGVRQDVLKALAPYNAATARNNLPNHQAQAVQKPVQFVQQAAQ